MIALIDALKSFETNFFSEKKLAMCWNVVPQAASVAQHVMSFATHAMSFATHPMSSAANAMGLATYMCIEHWRGVNTMQ